VAEVTLLRGLYADDRPWERLRWVLPSVIFAWAVFLWAFGFLLDRQPVLPAPQPIDATLIELPAEPPPPQVRRAEPRPVARLQETVKSAEPDRLPEPAPEPALAPVPQASAPPPPAPAPAARPPAPVDSGRAAARALYQPLPVIPDDLRDQAIEMEALARFDIKADGTATVALVKPTPIPALNRIVLGTLATWRFFPAMEGGRPVASTQEVRIKLQVR
jgi:periplasmic protein TonB